MGRDMGPILAELEQIRKDNMAYRETSEEIHKAYLQAHQERYKMNEALLKIAKTVKLDALGFNELAATVYETALEAMGVDDVRLD